MSNTFLAWLVAVIVIIAGIFYFIHHKAKPVVVATPGVTIASQTIMEGDATSEYQINAAYPVISGMATSSAQTKINTQMSQIISEDVAAFKNNQTGSVDASPSEDQSTLTVTFATTTQAGPTIISFVVDQNFYSAGAAHPGDQIDTYNFDTDTGQLLALSDLFTGNFLQTLSNYSRTSLAQQLGDNATEDEIDQGTDPTVADNFKAFIPESDGLHIKFNEYQVAAYSAGPQEVTVPYSKLKSFISSAGELAPLVK